MLSGQVGKSCFHRVEGPGQGLWGWRGKGNLGTRSIITEEDELCVMSRTLQCSKAERGDSGI